MPLVSDIANMTSAQLMVNYAFSYATFVLEGGCNAFTVLPPLIPPGT
jgi:hypothetical protein